MKCKLCQLDFAPGWLWPGDGGGGGDGDGGTEPKKHHMMNIHLYTHSKNQGERPTQKL